MASLRDLDKAVHSVARWIANLKPKYGKRVHYFVRMGAAEEIMRLPRSPDGKTCPLCGFRASSASGLVMHVLSRHKSEIVEALLRREKKGKKM